MKPEVLRSRLTELGLITLAVTEHQARPQILVVYLHGLASQWLDGQARALILKIPQVVAAVDSAQSPTIILAVMNNPDEPESSSENEPTTARPARPVHQNPDYMRTLVAFGNLLRAHRIGLGLTLAELGALVHVSGTLVSKMERAERHPQPDVARRLDQALSMEGALERLAAECRREQKNARQIVRARLQQFMNSLAS